MNTMSNYYMKACCGRRVKSKQSVASKALNIINKLLVVISIYLVFGLLFQHVYANVNSYESADENIDPYQTQHGSVWLLPDNGLVHGNYIEALQMKTDVNYEVTASLARATVKQQFKNSSEFWAEGIYVFPLPEKAAVDQFRMIIGDRIIEGKIKERVQAKKTYERAKAAGKKTSLIEQQRPNVFTTSLANIAPGEEISIEFEYQQVLDYKDGKYSLRFPMVVGPRYHTGQNHPGLDKKNLPSINELLNPAPGQTSVYTETDPLKNTNNATRIHVLLDAGASLSELNSSYHRININQTSETRYSISTIGENIVANRDFELVWKPELNNSPQLSAFKENINGDNYAMVSLLPPDLSHLQQKVQARDVIFVLDISGSMSGTSIEQAKASLMTALERLSSIDRFNVIWFNHETDSLFQKAVAASSQNKNIAKYFIDNLEADGGTEMLAALKLALSKQETFSRFRQVVFLTDGNISNETELFNVIDTQLGDNRLFTIGIGSAPNSYFMRKAANKGRGTFTYIGDVNEVQEKTIALFKKLETPALINIQLEIDREKFEVFPNIIPDLYAGEPITLLIKGKQLPQRIKLKGDYGNSEWQSSADLSSTTQSSTIQNSTSQSGIRIAWAREKIASLMGLHHESLVNTNLSDFEREAIQQEITDTALEHHLVSRFTSLVAVDVTPVNIEGLLLRQRMKNNLPHGWKRSSSSNGLMLAQTATGSTLNLILAFLLFVGSMLMHRFLYRRGSYI